MKNIIWILNNSLIFVIISLISIYSAKYSIQIRNAKKVDSLELKLKLQAERVEKQGRSNDRHSKLFQAECLAQGASESGIFDKKLLDDIISALDKMRKKYPEIQGIYNEGGVFNNLNPIVIDWPDQ